MRYLLVDMTEGARPGEGWPIAEFESEEEALFHAAEDPDRLKVVERVNR